MGAAGLVRDLVLASLTAVVAALAVAGAALAADPVTFGTPTATSKFGTSIEFKQPVVLAGTPLRVEVLISTPGAVA